MCDDRTVMTPRNHHHTVTAQFCERYQVSTIIIYVSDVFCMHVMYVWAVYNTHIAFVYEPQFIVYCRGLLMGLASIAVAVNHRRHTIAKADNKGVLADIFRIFLYLVVVIGSCILAWLLIASCLDRRSLIMNRIGSLPNQEPDGCSGVILTRLSSAGSSVTGGLRLKCRIRSWCRASTATRRKSICVSATPVPTRR